MPSKDKELLRFSDQFVISCGTVSVDVQLSKVLLIRSKRTGEYVLPKGRKDIGETLEETAIRETFEETGVRVKLLSVSIPTLATVPESVPKDGGLPKLVTEPIAMTQRTTAKGALKTIFWFVAAVVSTSAQGERLRQEDEDFETIWTDLDNVASILSFESDQRVAQKAVQAVRSLNSQQAPR